MRVRGYLSTCFGCPYEGDVPPARVADLARALLDLGVFEVAVSDTIGIAHPGRSGRCSTRWRRASPSSASRCTCTTRAARRSPTCWPGLAGRHHHLRRVRGGLGGCPYAPGATGNLATEDLVYMLHGLGIHTGVQLDALLGASAFIAKRLGTRLPSRYCQAWRASSGRQVS